MRLDKYLKVSRLIKRRTVANDACDGAKVSVNGRPAVEVLQVTDNVRKDDAVGMYREIAP